jgi:hypothetical protein
MLPLLKAGFADLDKWQSPYRPHQVPWTLTNYYLPATFIPYYLGDLTGHDIRYVTLICCDLVGIACLLAALKGPSPLERFRTWAMAILGFVLFVTLIHHYRLLPIIQLGPFWLWTALAFLGLNLGFERLSALFFVLAIGSREDAVIYTLIPALAFWRHRGGAGRRWVGWVVAGSVLVFLPFFIADPAFYLGNIKQYESLGFVLDQDGARFVGLAGFLRMAGLLWTRWLLLTGGLVGLCLLYVRRSRRFDPAEATRYAAGAALLFSLLAIVAWEYLYVADLLILVAAQ